MPIKREIIKDTKYKTGKIYILKHKDSDKQYIGSTIKPLNIRLSNHKTDYKRYLKGKKNYITCFELFDLGIDDVYIELLENCPCDNVIYLETRETYHIKNNECINTRLPYRTPEEWQEYFKVYDLNRKESKKETDKIRHAKNAQIKMSCRICRKEYSKATFPRHFRNTHKIN